MADTSKRESVRLAGCNEMKCQACSAPIKQPPRGRRRTTCGPACRTTKCRGRKKPNDVKPVRRLISVTQRDREEAAYATTFAGLSGSPLPVTAPHGQPGPWIITPSLEDVRVRITVSSRPQVAGVSREFGVPIDKPQYSEAVGDWLHKKGKPRSVGLHDLALEEARKREMVRFIERARRLSAGLHELAIAEARKREFVQEGRQ